MKSFLRGAAHIGSQALGAAALLALLAVASCSSGTPPPETVDGEGPIEPIEETPEPVDHPVATMLTIRPFQMGDHTGDDVMLRADGTLYGERAARVLGTVHPDGRFSDPQGIFLASLRDDGTIELAQGNELGIRISPEGSLQHQQYPDVEIQIREDGSIVGVDSSAESQGTDEPFGSVQNITPETRMTALFVLALMSELLGR
jgi:hypothetical protein